MRKRGSAGTSARSRRARPRKSTSARSSSSNVIKSTSTMATLRAQLANALAWHDANAGFDKAVDGLAPELRGRRPDRLPYSAWRLLEHLRLTQRAILDFCRDPKDVEPHWPDDYWPKTDAPPTPSAWDESVAGFRRDRQALQRILADSKGRLVSENAQR